MNDVRSDASTTALKRHCLVFVGFFFTAAPDAGWLVAAAVDCRRHARSGTVKDRHFRAVRREQLAPRKLRRRKRWVCRDALLKSCERMLQAVSRCVWGAVRLQANPSPQNGSSPGCALAGSWERNPHPVHTDLSAGSGLKASRSASHAVRDVILRQAQEERIILRGEQVLFLGRRRREPMKSCFLCIPLRALRRCGKGDSAGGRTKSKPPTTCALAPQLGRCAGPSLQFGRRPPCPR